MRLEIIYTIFLISFINIKCLNDYKSENLYNNNETSFLEVGKITYEIINHKKEFRINSEDNRNVLINFFSINCDIKIKTYINDSYASNKVNNMRNNDSISIYLKSNEISLSKIKVIHLNKNKNKYNLCPLVINTIYEENSSLEFTGNKPTILFFDKNLKEINLSYNFIKDNFTTFSFILNDIAKLRITYSYGEITKVKIISNSNKIFLPNLFEINEDKIINITIKRDDSNENPILLTLKVFTDNSGPMILHSNYLNQGFITSNFNTQYFYINISKDDEGEIILHDKRKKGNLLARICNINEDNCSADKINGYMNGNERENENNIEFNEHHKRLNFRYNQTKKCEEVCLLLITYQDNINTENNNNTIIGYDYTLLVRIWNREDWNTLEIINIPNNEYICGIFEENYINHHYYSAFVSNDTKKIILQIKSNYLEGFAGEGKKKLNTYYYELDNIKKFDLGEEMILPIESTDLINSNNYISFTFRPKNFFESEFCFYYFRIFQLKDEDKLILPMDSNYVNIWNPNITKNSTCYFIWKNDYNELSLNYSILDLNSGNNIKYIKNNDSVFDISQEKLNNITSNDSSFEFLLGNTFKGEKGYNNSLNYILFEFILIIEENNKNNKKVLSTIYNSKEIIKPQIYSPEIYQLDYNTTFDFLNLTKFSLTISWINGVGELYNLYNNSRILKLNNNNKNKPYSFYVENLEKVKVINKNDFAFYMSINYMTENSINLKELEKAKLFSEVMIYDNNPIFHFIKISEDESMYFNYKLLDFNNNFAEFSIEGMLCNDSIIKYIKNGEYDKFKSEKKGIYDICSKNGFLKMNYPQISYNLKEIEENNTNKIDYMLIKIEDLSSKVKTNILIEIFTITNIYNSIDIPTNQFIFASFSLKEENEKNFEFRITSGSSLTNNIIIEFSKNYEGIDIDKDRDIFGKSQIFLKEGYEKYKFNEISIDYFSINLKNKGNDLPVGFFMLRYYYENYDNDTEYEFNNQYKIIDKDNKSIFLKFESIKSLNKSLNNKTSQIYGNIFSKKKREELLNTTSFIYTEPINKKLLIANITNDSFIFNIPIDNKILENHNHTFILQIKVSIDIDDNDYQQNKILTYLVDLNLEELKKQNDKDKEKKKKFINIILGVFFSLLIIGIIILVILFFKLKKKNKNLEEQISKISYFQDEKEEEEEEINIV